MDGFVILICKHILKETSPQENECIENWLNKCTANQNYYDQIRSILDRMNDVKHMHQFDTNAAWAKMKSNMKNDDASNH